MPSIICGNSADGVDPGNNTATIFLMNSGRNESIKSVNLKALRSSRKEQVIQDANSLAWCLDLYRSICSRFRAAPAMPELHPSSITFNSNG
jgi:hypothetical protein